MQAMRATLHTLEQTIRLTSPKSGSYNVTWGEQSRTYTAKELTTGVNLAKDFRLGTYKFAVDQQRLNHKTLL